MLAQMLRETGKKYPKKTAIICDEAKLTYQELYAKVVGLSKGLRFTGVQQSDCVAILLPNCPEFVISFFAIARLNAIALPLNPAFKENEIKYYLADGNVRAIITDITRAELCRQVISQLRVKIDIIVIDGFHLCGLYFNDLIESEFEPDKNPAPYQGDVLYQYSSGSTGKPKRVCRTQKNLYHQALNCTATLNITASDNILAIVPMFHAYGLGECLLAAARTGATLIILEQFFKESYAIEMPFIFRRPRVLELIEKDKVTVLPGVPYIFSILAGTPPEAKADLSSLRLCISAGNFLSKDIFDKFLMRFGIPLRQLYGCTEAGAVAINLDSEAELNYDSIGLPMKNVEILVMDEEGNEVPNGTPGEIVIKSQTLTRGYHNLPEVNKEAFRCGHFFTGDLGKKDEKGRLYLTGRKKIFIDTGGQKVDPLEVEKVLTSHPKVEEAVVVGVKEIFSEGELIKAVIVAAGNCTEEEIISYCREQIADFKIPRRVEFRQQLPKNPLGKVLRKQL